MAVIANLAAGTLTVTGDAADNSITTSRDLAGTLEINGGAVPIAGGPSTTANTTAVQVLGQDGSDTLTLDASNGALPNIVLEGGNNTDTADIESEDAGEVFTIVPNGSRVRFDRVSPDPFSVDIGTTENLVLHANGGDDTITASNGLAALISLTLDGGAGNDTITGGDGADLLIGGTGNDTVAGGRGNDTALLGDGDDTFIWNPGDGSDSVEGQDGNDTLQFNGANIAEQIDISANGSRVRFTRDVAGIVMDLNGVEKVAFLARGGADHVTVHDLTGTDTNQVLVDLAATPGGSTGDGAADTVTVEGTAAADQINISQSGSNILVNGLAAEVSISGQEGANDALKINAFGGNDTINASALPAGQLHLTIDAGDGDDTVIGSAGADTIIGGIGNDTVTGGRGDDTALLGDGDDTLIWNPGDGSDVVEGQAGTDTLQFNGANIAEKFDISANGGRVRFTRDVANIVMDLNGVEKINIDALGGADTVTVNDLSGTNAQQIAIDLSASGGSADGALDTVVANATAGADTTTVTNSGNDVLVNGLAAQVVVHGQDASDVLQVNGLGGDDQINASGLAAGLIALTINAGAGNDLIVGSAGGDTVIGGQGNDTALLGGGDDTFTWNPGDGSDTVEGQGGNDTLQFNGANIAENIDISANGSRVRFTRDVASIVMDLNGVEKIAFQALGGADHVTVHDLAGTDTNQVLIDLASTPGGSTGDGAADTVTVEGTAVADQINVTQSGSKILVDGLAAEVSVSGQEAANDTLTINAGDGDDIIDASGLGAGQIKVVVDAGIGDDIVTGSAGGDRVTLGAGNDSYVYKPTGGPDTVTDFVAGAGTDDRIDLRPFASLGFHELATVLPLAAQVGADTVINFGGGNTLTLLNVLKTDLSEDDFVFGGPGVTSVTTSGTGITAGNGLLTVNDEVTFTVTFDEPVIVTGQPALLLNDGGIATFSTGSGTATLTFIYQVAADQSTSDLAIAGIDLDTATMTDGLGKDAEVSGLIVNPAGILQIDAVAPQATAVTAIPADGHEGVGSVITLAVAFDEAVTVTGTPLLTLNDGGLAHYVSGSGTGSLTYQYIVAAGENTADLAVTGSNLNGGTIRDQAGNDADLAGAAVNPAGTLQIDTTAAHVTGVAATPSDGHEAAGSVITFAVAFDEIVNVAGGNPTLTLNDGGVAHLAGGSGTATLTYQYTVATGENTADLAVTGSSLNGATIRDQAGNDADLAGAVGNPTGTLHVDTTAPQLGDITASPASGNQAAGALIQFTLDFDEAVQVAGGTPTLSLNDGGTASFDAVASALLGDASKLVFDYLVSAGDAPTASLAITGLDTHGAVVTDLAGNLADLGHVSELFSGLSVNENAPPAGNPPPDNPPPGNPPGGNSNVLPAFTINGFTRPELHLDSTGHILLDATAAAFAGQFGLEYLYLGAPSGTPFPPVDLH
ncbi:calcium-binding protein [Bradyrhizobium sp. CCBAU 51753]|uniref:beta strand repeat-containing protein n=1 Tax=Bradyrhizobium sp. CCBAU 51753 TaxID=1325100 RepID=UPI00188C5910|nr:calcium-binding protein [Bradyrhizobium sp. CCBAU 51753]QOZ27723.1 hypothetical protein XH93_31990 [Bradyrhizobium sp. CCBAU 51753]